MKACDIYQSLPCPVKCNGLESMISAQLVLTQMTVECDLSLPLSTHITNILKY